MARRTTQSVARCRAAAITMALMAATAANAAPATGRRVFISCPILRNTTLPCWLGQDGVDLYYLGPQGDLTADFYPPQFHHRMLVEGEVSDAPKICGGIVLKNVTASVLPDFDDSCNVMLPAEGYADPPNQRGSGPSGVRGGTPPPQPPRKVAEEAPKPPFAPREFAATFNADSDRKWRQAETAISQAWRYAKATSAQRVEVVGYRAAIRLSNGQVYVEHEAIAADRARATEDALEVLGLPKSAKLVVTWRKAPTPATGTANDAGARRAVIKVIPGAGG